MARKILYSPGYGAGWSSWNTSNSEVARYMLTYKPIVNFIEAGKHFTMTDCHDEPYHPLLDQLIADCRAAFGEDLHVCILGADDLQVLEVEGEVKIEEYDGFESVVTRNTDTGWM